ncbi:SNARE associated Golgi protein family [Wolffia australiana]
MGRKVALLIFVAAAVVMISGRMMNRDAAMEFVRQISDRLGPWALPVFVTLHTVTIALCLPYAIFFEAVAPVLFGFLPAVACVFSAKLLGASLSFSIGRLIFRSSKSAMEWVRGNRYFHLLVRGVEHDGWKFVLLARFSPLPSYMINYSLAATDVSFFLDFLLPTAIGCLPMILQNTSIGSLAGAAMESATGSGRFNLSSYLFPMLGIFSSILISLRIKRYSSLITAAEDTKNNDPSKKID